MDTPEKDSSNPLVPLIIGAAAGAAIAYFFATESNEGSGKLTETLSKGWETLKEKVPALEDELNSFKDRILDTVKSNIKAEADHSSERINDV